MEKNTINSTNKRIVILAPASSQPRFHRRAKMLLAKGYEVVVYTFKRGLYEKNTFPEGVEVIELGYVKLGNFLLRIPKIIKAALKIRVSERKQSIKSVFYAFSLDMAIIGLFSKSFSPFFVYEVGDIRNPLPHKSLFSKTISMIEKHVLNKCSALVITSPCFLNEYFVRLLPNIESKTVVLENKLSRDVANNNKRPVKPLDVEKPIKIGFVGLFRYRDSLVTIMEAVAKKRINYELHFFGDGPERAVIEEYFLKYHNIFNHGPFRSIEDLADIYKTIHISYAVYNALEHNVRMALPNKLYEAIYFGVPIVVADKTYLSEVVRSFNLGYVLDTQHKCCVEGWLEKINMTEISKLSKHLLTIDSKVMVESYDDINSVLEKIQ
jgi:succinoglycan biosynthesis protein ExoL